MGRAAVLLCYHKNVHAIYKDQWLNEYVKSITGQTARFSFDILEMDYGDQDNRLFSSSRYYKQDHPNFIHAMNFLIEEAVGLHYQYILNSNVDDTFSTDRVELQLKAMEEGWDILSSNFSLMSEDKGIYHTHKFDGLDVKREIKRGHNIICHPSVCYRADFFDEFKYNPEEILNEDLKLWQRAVDTKRFRIIPEVTCYHRIHTNNVCNSNNR